MNVLAVAIWIAVVVSSVLLVRGLRRARPAPAAPAAGLHDLSEAAFLVGGPGTVVDTALVSMLGDGRLLVGGPGIVQVRPGAWAGDPTERAVLQAHAGAPSGWLYQVRYAAMCDPAVQEIGDALAARGLVAPPGTGRAPRRWGLVQAVVCGVWLVASVPLTVVEFALDADPGVPFVVTVAPALFAGLVLGLFCRARAGNRVTPAGLRALLALRSAYGHDHSPHVQTALFGLRGLRDPFLRRQLVPAVRGTRLAAAQSGARPHRRPSSSSDSSAELLPVLWCATSDGGGGSGDSGCGSGSGCGSSGSGCGSSGSGCGGGSGSSCGSSSSGSSCSSSSGSSCSSSSSSSCSSSSSSS
ncbi:TIGR04222 domain-containing membrane protein [Streptomyces yangpuensis]|uniref:TIGR04222 domain-containing membrane protein n=1 Tax=Streptomyces yangpuensis TaxID=1648182 RepID=A0ABY5Q2A4_9ACTN|nr:TIGR04222 domain-containing membrane protein [Streptomyces yangpuensis]UUY50506.1 TIGR04222 domain-containing membrane protein [Streptomyces yangpuensis]